ncbi:hypothetical protein Bhyg_04835 [Pseudolycoriella hygida]|uniref:Uncharacterized protein n=1 Tax=Pseudolycoriella hygida TaxID=35572 RepID=A0A9Q0S8V3_9DIPT|nr:hypothetical protein Bhyg_04835 [Pseudolycoriella hygida]
MRLIRTEIINIFDKEITQSPLFQHNVNAVAVC